MKTTIVKYNAGNIRSVLFALERMGVSADVTDDPEELRTADRVIFPGVGEASTAMQYLRGRKLDNVIRELKQPVLGICLGMQLLCKHSEENDTDCLGIIDLSVRRFPPAAGKVPQIGWNSISGLSTSLFRDVEENAYVYSVHSYYVEKSEYTIAVTHYGTDYSAAIHKDNFYAVQFHPEKSADVGEQILRNFLEHV